MHHSSSWFACDRTLICLSEKFGSVFGMIALEIWILGGYLVVVHVFGGLGFITLG